MPNSSKRHRFRALLGTSELVVAPGAYDAIMARLIEQAGFPAVYMTGAGTSLARGFPDYGLLTLAEMVENAGVIARSVQVPLISDADTGYGDALNVTRTVREFEQRGVAAIHIEDQVTPKRCGHLEGKEVVSRQEYVWKIRAAAAARTDPDFVIIARTDSRAVLGFDEAIARANLALAAGADVAFVEAVQTQEEMVQTPKLVKGPCLLNVVPGGKTPAVSMADVAAMGYRIAILPGVLLNQVIPLFDRVLADLKQTGMPAAPTGAGVKSVYQRFGSDDWDAIRENYDPNTGG